MIRTLIANFRWGKWIDLFLVLSNVFPLSCFDRRLRMARVCLGRRSRGRYFFPLQKRRSCARWLALMTVRTFAIDFRRSWLLIKTCQLSVVCLLPPPLNSSIDRSVYFQIDTHIFVSLEADPPAIFCTFNCPNSVFNSPSCLWRSSFPLVQSEPVLIFPDDCRIEWLAQTYFPTHLRYRILPF